jgi:hypothetical protein
MRNQVDLFAWNPKYILENARRVLAHHNQPIGARGDLLHDYSLVEVRLTENSMERRDHRHSKVLQQLQDVAAGIPSKNPILMLQAH